MTRSSTSCSDLGRGRAIWLDPLAEGLQACGFGDSAGSAPSLTVGLIGTFPPRACGLATFTSDVATSLRAAGNRVVVAALVDGDECEAVGVTYRLMQTSAESARAVATALSTEVDVVLIQHEFGIFGGRDRPVLKALTDSLAVPYVLTLHTVTERYLDRQRGSLIAPLAGASLVLVFSEQAVALLAAQFSGVEARCYVVPHPAPAEMYQPRSALLRHGLGLPVDAKVVLTFGLLSPSKGIDHAICAMAALRQKVRDVVYVVAGGTHPEVVRRRHGERYRNQLLALCQALKVDDIVSLRNWFHDVDEMSACCGRLTCS